MLIAIDFDGTYSLDPSFWDLFIDSATYKGYTVICVTMRYKKEGAEIKRALAGKVKEIIFTGRKAKRKFAHNHGYYPDIRIDDSPHCLYIDSKSVVRSH